MDTNTEYYLSNGGKGPEIARIISVEDGVITLERRPSLYSKSRWRKFVLSEKFFNSLNCGWRKSGRKIEDKRMT